MEAHIEVSEIARRKRVLRKPAAEPRSYGRSKISNGRDLLPDIDGRSLVARRYRDIVSAILADQAGADQCSEARKQLIRRFAAAAVLAERLESRLANGEEISITEHATLASTLVRLSAKIGIDRVPHDMTPTLAEYLARNYAAQGEAEPAADAMDDEPELASEATGEPADGRAVETPADYHDDADEDGDD